MQFRSFIFSTFLLTSSLMAAPTEVGLRIVDNYSAALNPEIWKKIGNDEVPGQLVRSQNTSRPALAFGTVFPKVFFQEEHFLVCFENCKSDASNEKDKLEQQTVYYWLGKFYEMAKDQFQIVPSNRIQVSTNRDVKNPGSSKVMKNNAFFNPATGSLTFLPASSNPLAVILGGKINRSGFDPSVVAHEAGHTLFDILIPNAVNDEMSGVNEGFADYMANILLNNPKVGAIMLRGKAIRDSDAVVDSNNKPKVYEPKLESHDMGERFAAALWKGRAKVDNKEEYDHQIMSAIKEVGHNPFATGHGFKEAFLERVSHFYPSETAGALKDIWNFFVPGEDRVINDTSFLTSKFEPSTAFGLKITTKFSDEVQREHGIENDNSRFLLIRSVKTADKFVAFQIAQRTDEELTPYWILVDPERSNALGAWRLDGTSIENKDVKAISSLVRQLLGINEVLADFITKADGFSRLVQGQGDLAKAYKVSKHNRTNGSIKIDGNSISVIKHEITLKRRLLARVLGVPNIKGFAITTANLKLSDKWPKLEGSNVIGIRLDLEDGTTSETMLDP